MTREEAINTLGNFKRYISGGGVTDRKACEAIDMAIEALHREEAEEKGYCHRIRPSNVEIVVRCKDCKFLNRKEAYGDEWKECTHYPQHHIRLNDFCSYGERKEE